MSWKGEDVFAKILRLLAGSNEAAMGSATAFVVCALALALSCAALFCVGAWRTFSKMGLPGWIGIIPVVGTVAGLSRAAGRIPMAIIVAVRAIAYVVIFVSVANDKIRFLVTAVALLVVVLTHAAEGLLIARRFGFGVVFSLFTGLIPPVFLFILGMSDAEFGDDELEAADYAQTA